MKDEICKELLSRISAGRIVPGQRLPSERELAKEFGCTLWAAHSALSALQEQNFIERRGVHGSFVKERLSLNAVHNCRSTTSNRVLLVLANGLYRERLPIEQMISSLEARLKESSLELIYGDLPKTPQGFTNFLRSFQQEGFKALVLFPDHSERNLLCACAQELDNFTGNLICFNRGLGDPDDLPCHCLSVDLRHEGRLAARYLLEHGCRQLAFFRAAYNSVWWMEERLAGIRHTLKNTGFKINLHEWPPEEGNRGFPEAERLIIKYGTKTGIVAANDEVAAQLLDFLKSRDLQAGRDFSLISYDNAAPFRKYGLCSIELALDQAVDILTDLIINGGRSAASHIHLNYRLSSQIVERPSIINNV